MGIEAGAPVLTVYSRSCCHLCDEMIAALRGLQGRYRFDLSILDVDADPALERRYGEDVPVLAHGARELCRHRLEAGKVADYLAKIG
jgi:hypothetical protein